jgi:hypothetical protein
VEFVDVWEIPSQLSQADVRDDQVVVRIRRPVSDVSGANQERAWWAQVITGAINEGMEAWQVRGDTGNDHTEPILLGEPFHVPIDEVFNSSVHASSAGNRSDPTASDRTALERDSGGGPVPGMPPIALERVLEAAANIASDRRWLKVVSDGTSRSDWLGVADRLPGVLPRSIGESRQLGDLLEGITNLRPDARLMAQADRPGLFGRRRWCGEGSRWAGGDEADTRKVST